MFVPGDLESTLAGRQGRLAHCRCAGSQGRHHTWLGADEQSMSKATSHPKIHHLNKTVDMVPKTLSCNVFARLSGERERDILL